MKQQINEVKRMQQLAGVVNEAMKVNDKGELQNLPLETDIEDAAHLHSLNFDVSPIDPTERFYYLELPNGTVSIASKIKDVVLNLKTKYPETWANAVLKYDNQWQTGENEDDEINENLIREVNKINNKMKQQINEVRRMQQLAGLIKENQMMGMDEEEYDNMVDTVKHTLETMSPKQFTELITSLGELDIWEMGLEQEGIDGINNIEDRMNTVDMAFEDEDYKKYYDKLKELNLINENMGELVGNTQPTSYLANFVHLGGYEALSTSELLAWANYAYPKIKYTPETPVSDLIEKLRAYYGKEHQFKH